MEWDFDVTVFLRTAIFFALGFLTAFVWHRRGQEDKEGGKERPS